MLNSLQREGSRTQVSRDAQIFLYNLSKEIRNAKDILALSEDTLTFRQYDFSQGYDYDPVLRPNLYSPTRMSTVTYSVVLTGDRRRSGPTYSGNYEALGSIRRVEHSPNGMTTNIFFKGIVVAPLSSVATTYVFTNPGGGSCPCFGVRAKLRLVPSFHEPNPLEYSIESAVRAYAG